MQAVHKAGQEVHVTSTPPPLASAMVNEVPGVEHAVRLWQWSDVVISYEDKVFTRLQPNTSFSLRFKYNIH